MTREAARLADTVGHRFQRVDLLDEALTHSSIASRGHRQRPSYERLEFLGDRVLGLVVAEMLITRFPQEAEGALARRLAALVRRESLVRVAEEIDLGGHLALSKAEEDAGGRANPAILADCCEAVIGALYLDGGLDVAAAFVRRHWRRLMEESTTPPKDAKTALQEWAQGLGKPLPVYEMVAMQGPPHDPIFEVAVRVEGMGPETAQGPSKRAAEQAAATAMLKRTKV